MKPSQKLLGKIRWRGQPPGKPGPTEVGKLLESEGYKSGYQLVHGWAKTGVGFDEPRDERNRRAVERVLGLPVGWMDDDDSSAPPPGARGAIHEAVQEYLGSTSRGRSTPAGVATLLLQGSAFQGLGITSPTWDDVDDVRRILERHAAPPPPRKSDSEPAHRHVLDGVRYADPNAPPPPLPKGTRLPSSIVPSKRPKPRGRG